MDQMYGYYHDEMILAHHGVLGQRWGIRRYQNADGSLTAAGKRRAAKADYKETKKNIKDTRKKLLDKDNEKIEDDYGNGKISYWEASRRGGNSEDLRSEQARARRLAAKSEMNAKLAENSTGISKSIREAKAKHEAKRAELWSKEASKTKKMINITNDVFKNRVNTGERIASELFMTDEVRNRYYLSRANMSAARSLGKTVMENIMDYPYYA